MNMNTEMIEEAQVVEPPKFEPGKAYSWNATDEFKLLGSELNTLHNTLHVIFSEDIPEPKTWVLIHNLYKITSDLVKRGVESGIIKEAPEPQNQTS